MLNQTSVTEFLPPASDTSKYCSLFSLWFSLQLTLSMWLGMQPSWWLSSLIQGSTSMYFFLWKLVMSRYLLLHGDSAKDAGELPLYTQSNFFLGMHKPASFLPLPGQRRVPVAGRMGFDRLWLSANHFITLIMSHQVCVQMAVTVWIIGFFHALLHSVMTSHLKILWFQSYPPLLLVMLSHCWSWPVGALSSMSGCSILSQGPLPLAHFF